VIPLTKALVSTLLTTGAGCEHARRLEEKKIEENQGYFDGRSKD
jgi:hypothetical protein